MTSDRDQNIFYVNSGAQPVVGFSKIEYMSCHAAPAVSDGHLRTTNRPPDTAVQRLQRRLGTEAAM